MNCSVCKTNMKISKYGNVNLCRNMSCKIKYLNYVNKTEGLTSVIHLLETERKKVCFITEGHYKNRFNLISKEKLNERRIRKYRNIENVYRVLLSEGLVMVIGLNYSYKVNRKGQLSKIYNLNEEFESLEEIKRRLNKTDCFLLEPFLIILDDRKSIEKYNQKNGLNEKI